MWLIHSGRPKEAVEHCAAVERAAALHGDEILHSLAGLVRGWVYLAEDDIPNALEAMRSVVRLGGDYHQHHFIDMYIALALFRQGDYVAAAGRWYEAMRNALVVGHMRGVAGAIEGCAYIAERIGKRDEACRFLGAAEQIRKRAESPLFSFWIRHNESANASLRSTLGVQAYEAAVSDGARMREEDAANEAAAVLRELGAGSGAERRTRLDVEH
jgi:tetratricopeptide (TPR) repeat protein